MTGHFLIKKLAVTEKAGDLQRSRKYVFIVELHATKNEIRKAVKLAYKVDAVRVNIVRRPPKVKRFRGLRGVRPDSGYKKAVVTLKEGQKIELTG